MEPERWERINTLFRNALEREPSQRAAFLAEVCGGDDLLRLEVESLIAHHERAEDFIEKPAIEVAAEVLTDDRPLLVPGELIGHFEVLAFINKGGMGEVYSAWDPQLGRRVALKLLPTRFSHDQDRLRRFKREARAASALNHPNILTIYEIGQRDAVPFIAAEYVDGETLRRRIERGRLTLAETVDTALQVASALEAAHAGGIIHRDVKPENIMLRRDGIIKVLDFGLAKLTEAIKDPRAADSEASTVTKKTEPGMVMGTVGYMSPEQVRGLSVDGRTDVWSLGVVLYEMASGRRPFEGATIQDVNAMILERQPPPLSLYAAEVPAEFQRVVRKALAKEREERYQTIADLASGLEKLQRELEVERTKKVRAWATAKQFVGEVKRHKKVMITAVAVGAFVLAGIGFRTQVRKLFGASTPPPPAQMARMTPLTNSGESVCAAISPDGQYVAHVEGKGGKQSLLITRIANNSTSTVIPAGDEKYQGLTFSRDGYHLYYTIDEGADVVGRLYQVAVPGGFARRLRDGVDSPITFSPTGRQFAFVNFDRSEGVYSLMVAEADGAGERVLATRRDGNRFSLGGPAWSPDGKTIVCAAGRWDNGHHMHLIEVDAENGQETVVSGRQWFSILQVAWLEGKNGLIVCAAEQPMNPYQLWRLSYPQGESSKVTYDLADYHGVSLSSDASMLVSVRSSRVSKILIAPDGDAQRAKEIVKNIGLSYGLSWGRDGKIVFTMMVRNNLNIAVIHADGSGQRRLTDDVGNYYHPATSADGRYIVFASNRTETFNIWRMNADDGSDLRQLTFSDGNFYPSCSPDNQWVVYENQGGAKTTLWRVPINGGNSERLTGEYAGMPVVSPDNQYIACRSYIEAHRMGIAVMPFQGGPPIERLPIPIMEWQRVQWTPNGHALTYIVTANGISNIWSYDRRSGLSKQLTYFNTDQIFSYAWSPDSKQLACERGTRLKDAIIISNYR